MGCTAPTAQPAFDATHSFVPVSSPSHKTHVLTPEPMRGTGFSVEAQRRCRARQACRQSTRSMALLLISPTPAAARELFVLVVLSLPLAFARPFSSRVCANNPFDGRALFQQQVTSVSKTDWGQNNKTHTPHTTHHTHTHARAHTRMNTHTWFMLCVCCHLHLHQDCAWLPFLCNEQWPR